MNTDRIQRLNSLLERIKRNAALPKQLLGKGFVLGGAQAPRGDVSTGPSVPAVMPVPLATPRAPKAEVAAESAVRPAAESAVRSHPTPPTKPVQAPLSPSISSAHLPQARAPMVAMPSPSTSSANLPQAHAPMVAMPSVSGTSFDGRRPRQRVATMIGVAPIPSVSPSTSKTEETIEEVEVEVEVDEVQPVDAAGSQAAPTRIDAANGQPTPVEASAVEASAVEASAVEASPIEASLISAGAAQRDEASQTEVRKPLSDIDNLSWSEPPVAEVAVAEPPPPDSSRRPRVAGSIDEALAEVTAGTELEIPVKTPPPESGRQPTEGVYAASVPSAAVPTLEQLGETLELEEPTVAMLELDLGQAKLEPVKEELELELPQQTHVLEPPASEHRAPEPSHVEEIAVESGTAVTVASAHADDTLLSDSDSLQLQPVVTSRKATDRGLTIELLQSARGFAPQSFAELLDASLKLGSNLE